MMAMTKKRGSLSAELGRVFDAGAAALRQRRQ